mgnify:FL=1
MMINVLSHPAVPLVLGSLLIFLIRSKSNLLSFISLTLSIIVLLFIMPHENAFYIEKGIQINYFAYSKLSFLFCLVFLIIGIIGKIFSIYRDSYKEKAMILYI